MCFELSEDHRMVRQMVADFAAEHVAPRAAYYDRTGEFPWDNIRKMAELGLMGVMVPPEYGGAGMDSLAYVLVIEEISRACAATGVITAVQNSLAAYPIMKFGTEEQKKKYLPLLASGAKIGAYALTEPGSGSDSAAMLTRAERVGDHWVLNGQKNWITNSTAAEIFIVYATLDPALYHKGITCFIIEKDFPGFAVGKREETLGVRASGTCQLILDGCRVPRENVLGAEGEGFKIAMATLDTGRVGIAAQAVGIAQAALDHALRYAQERQQFKKPIAEFQLVQEMLVWMATHTEAARLMTYKAALKRDSGERFSMEASQAKWYASEVAMQAALYAVQIHGGYGYSKEYPVERLMRDAKVTQIYEGTSEIQKLVIARNLLGKK
ncbi:MAG TPA: acyl-CoA dehydrogenase [Candidatus Nitrosotenuis sp.]|nr:acyl-CoA dehydrogenase [Candidatus Nitrosotenuis sp.]